MVPSTSYFLRGKAIAEHSYCRALIAASNGISSRAVGFYCAVANSVSSVRPKFLCVATNRISSYTRRLNNRKAAWKKVCAAKSVVRGLRLQYAGLLLRGKISCTANNCSGLDPFCARLRSQAVGLCTATSLKA